MAVVLITGCSTGIGPRTALAFARRGDRVYATMRRAERGRELVDRAAGEGLDVRVIELDVTDDGSVGRAVSEVLDAEGRVDVVVNNAGLVHVGSVELLPDEAMRETFETNLYGPVRVLRAVLPAMRAAGSGVIVNVSSTAGRVAGIPVFWSYMASKHGLSVLSDSLAMELEPFGIKVLSIEPGFVQTPIIDKAYQPRDAHSPYRGLDDAVGAFLENGCAGGADADTVAQAIVDAVDHDDGRVHILVGDDAHMFVAQQESSNDAEMAAFYKEVIGIETPAAVTV
jgi:NAD(P)-dependent dehydrogenase (short-subunit alcohol dehydrogenase family)